MAIFLAFGRECVVDQESAVFPPDPNFVARSVSDLDPVFV